MNALYVAARSVHYVSAMLLFGGKKIPELAKGLGEGIRNFKTALKDDKEEKVEEKKQA